MKKLFSPKLIWTLLALVALAGMPVTGNTAWAEVNGNPGGDSDHAETGSLERSIESWIRNALDDIIPPNLYTVYVQLTYDTDSARMAAIAHQEDVDGLPGMPASNSVFGSPLDTPLFHLVKRKHIILVLDHQVSTEQETLAKDIITTKIEMHQSAGDRLEARHTEMPRSSEASANGDQSASSNWLRFASIFFGLALVGALGALGWQLSGRTHRIRAGEGQPARTPTQELRSRLLKLVSEHPRATTRVCRQMMETREGLKKIALLITALGDRFKRRLYKVATEDQRELLDEYLSADADGLTIVPLNEVLFEVHTRLLTTIIDFENGLEDSLTENPSPIDATKREDIAALITSFDREDDERRIHSFFEAEHPALAESIRNESLTLVQLANVPTDVLASAFESTDPGLLCDALLDAGSGVKKPILKALGRQVRPLVELGLKKKAPLAHGLKKETETAQVIVLALVEKELRKRGIPLNDIREVT